MRYTIAALTSFVIGLSGLLTAQTQEFARVLRNGQEATLSAFGPRPVDLAARKLVDEFGIVVNVEDPLYFYRDDVEDVTARISRIPNPTKRTIAPKPWLLEIAFETAGSGAPRDVSALLQTLVDGANAQTPFAYRLDRTGEESSLVPTQTRDEQGHVVPLTSALDHRVTIPFGVRTFDEHIRFLTSALAAQGVRAGCCSAIAGPWPGGDTVPAPPMTFEWINRTRTYITARFQGNSPKEKNYPKESSDEQ